MITQPIWLDRLEFPFTSRTFAHADGNMHYVDEGRGPILLFVHGTPDWSFGFRHLIKAFRASHRCISIDHLGFGLSDKPAQGNYTVKAHAARLQDFIDHLGLKDVTIVVTDFGGGIGLQHALEHPGNVKGIVLYNTWMWPLNDDERFARPAHIARSWFGRQLYLHLGFSVNVMMPRAYGVRRKLSKAIHAHYKNALPDAASRIASHAFAREILDAGSFWNEQWKRSERLRGIPMLLCWGMKDRWIPQDFLDRWHKAIPGATLVAFPSAGHFIHEEAEEELVHTMRAFVAAAPRATLPPQ